MGRVQKFLDRALKNGWKIAKRIDFPNTDMYNYHLVPANGGDGYIVMWCKGENELDSQYNEERYPGNYEGKTIYETGISIDNAINHIVFYEVVDDGGEIIERFSADDTEINDVFVFAKERLNDESEKCRYDIYRVEKQHQKDGGWNYLDNTIIKSFCNYAE